MEFGNSPIGAKFLYTKSVHTVCTVQRPVQIDTWPGRNCGPNHLTSPIVVGRVSSREDIGRLRQWGDNDSAPTAAVIVRRIWGQFKMFFVLSAPKPVPALNL